MAGPTLPAAIDPPGYATDCACHALMANGEIVGIRPIRPDDAPALIQFHEQLSAESVHRRFFSVHPHLLPAEVERFTSVDYRDRLALVVEVGGSLRAVARYDRLEGTDRAEVAFVVADALHGQGLGTLLLEHLAAAGRQRGLRTFFAETLAENHPMIEVFKQAGFPCHLAFRQGVVEVSFPIALSQRFLDAVIERHLHAMRARFGPLVQATDVVDPEDLLAWSATDDRCPVVALRLAQVARPRRFVALARAVAQRKPVIAVLRADGQAAMALAGLCQQAGVETVRDDGALAQRSGQLLLELAAGTWQPVARGTLPVVEGCDGARGRLALGDSRTSSAPSVGCPAHPEADSLSPVATGDLLAAYGLTPWVLSASPGPTSDPPFCEPTTGDLPVNQLPQGLRVTVTDDARRGLAVRFETPSRLGEGPLSRALPLTDRDAQELVAAAAPRCGEPDPLVRWVLRVARLVDDQSAVRGLDLPVVAEEDQGPPRVWVGPPRSTDDDPFVSKLPLPPELAFRRGESEDFEPCRVS